MSPALAFGIGAALSAAACAFFLAHLGQQRGWTWDSAGPFAVVLVVVVGIAGGILALAAQAAGGSHG